MVLLNPRSCKSEVTSYCLDSSKITSMNYMFNGCSSLTSLDLSNLNLKSCGFFGHMFDSCSKLKTLTGLNSWQLISVNSCSSMFYNCSSLTSLDLSNCRLVLDNNMFYNCYSLETLDISGVQSWYQIANDSFKQCSSLTNLTVGYDFASYPEINLLDFQDCPLSYDSAVNMIERLATRDNSPTIMFNSMTYGLLGDYNIQIATNKGWTVTY